MTGTAMQDAGIYSQQLTDKEFSLISDYIHRHCGIRLPENKKNMVEGRIRKRLKALGLSTYKEYIAIAFDEEHPACGTEQLHLIDALTTNKTDFFREPNHFSYMSSTLLPELARYGYGTEKCLNVWSSACSTGEEPYTLAMVLAETFGPGGNFTVYATDISYNVLKKAVQAVYTEEKAEDIPYELRRKYLMRSKNRQNRLVRFIPQIRQKVVFGRLNLMDDNYRLKELMDIVFCRNVIIYFDHETQYSIIRKICGKLRRGGHLFLGHSESVHGMELPLETKQPTIFKRI